jgi:glycerol-3-phosphate acyltransferase PlsX
MRERTHEEPITQKNPKASQNVPIAENHAFLIASVPIAAFTMDNQSTMEKKSSPLPSIGLDIMGSDEDSAIVLTSLLPIFEQLKGSARFVVFGDGKNSKLLKDSPLCSYQIAEDAITMEDDPLWAVRKKKNSSLHLGMQALKKKQIQAFISMGNTGALMATARLSLETLPKISRPALLTLIPTKNREMAVLDVGANATFKESHLVEFAAMGIAYQKARGIPEPKVGLLNIGTEARKGPPEIQKAYQALAKSYPFFCGNIEGRDAFEGHLDVLVSDGFTGNIFLKTSEGIARFLLNSLGNQSELQELRRRLDYSEYPGALLCGVDGLVMKCHGTGKSSSLYHSLTNAISLLNGRFLDLLTAELSLFFSKEP